MEAEAAARQFPCTGIVRLLDVGIGDRARPEPIRLVRARQIVRAYFRMAKRHMGSDFDAFPEEEGLLEDVTVIALKRYIAYQLTAKMKEENLTKRNWPGGWRRAAPLWTGCWILRTLR
jgi:hypothetical protein